MGCVPLRRTVGLSATEAKGLTGYYQGRKRNKKLLKEQEDALLFMIALKEHRQSLRAAQSAFEAVLKYAAWTYCAEGQ